MLKKRNQKGEGYLDYCIGVIVFVMLLILSLNLFHLVALRVELDEIAGDLLESATYTGCFGEDFLLTEDALKEDYGDFEVVCSADSYYNEPLKEVQLGNRMEVLVTVDTKIQGVGDLYFPIRLSVKKSGLSEKYWKRAVS